MYASRRDVLVDGRRHLGWELEKPKATVFLWAKIPSDFISQGSMEFGQMLLSQADVAVCPGVGFGSNEGDYVRLALMENEVRLRSAIRRIASLEA